MAPLHPALGRSGQKGKPEKSIPPCHAGSVSTAGQDLASGWNPEQQPEQPQGVRERAAGRGVQGRGDPFCKYLETEQHWIVREFQAILNPQRSTFKSYSYFKVPFESQFTYEVSGIMLLSFISSFSKSPQYLSSYT